LRVANVIIIVIQIQMSQDFTKFPTRVKELLQLDLGSTVHHKEHEKMKGNGKKGRSHLSFGFALSYA
jgi:hypothetical protein